MDEWLAAGDASFLDKAQKRMQEFVGGSNIVVLASHSLPLLQQWCNRAILLDRGHMTATGAVDDVVGAYESSLERAKTA
jgi:ABC-type polysaccharide/polyol phosphate transport system ATPase subunit